MFRAQAERWLEFLVREDLTRIDSCWINTLRSTNSRKHRCRRWNSRHLVRNAIGPCGNCRTESCGTPGLFATGGEILAAYTKASGASRFPSLRIFQFRRLTSESAARVPGRAGASLPSRDRNPAQAICILQVEVVRVGLAESWRRGLCVVLGQSFLVSRIRISPTTFACSTGYTSRAFRKVIPREFLRKDSPPEPSVLD